MMNPTRQIAAFVLGILLAFNAPAISQTVSYTAAWLLTTGGTLTGTLIVDTTTTPQVGMVSTDGGAAQGPTVELYRNSASPAASDVLGGLDFYGEDSAGNKQLYGQMFAVAADPTSGTEDAYIQVNTITAGTPRSRVRLGMSSAANADPLSVAGTNYQAYWTTDFASRIGVQYQSTNQLRFFGVAVNSDILGLDFSDGSVVSRPGTALPAGGNNTVGYKATTTANFGVFFGSGAPSLSAARGSLYLRSDGTTTNDRAYINTDGGTTWTAIITSG
jgi:hypothetical protein